MGTLRGIKFRLRNYKSVVFALCRMLAWCIVVALCAWIAWRERTRPVRKLSAPGYVTLAHMHWQLLHSKAMAMYYLEKMRRLVERKRSMKPKCLPRWKSF